ncbi:MAG: DUF2167 domain-containing protein [Thermodesulfobacteriota bacterium]
MKYLSFVISVFCLLFITAVPAFSESEAKGEMTVETFLASLNFQEGDIVLADNLVTLNLPDSFRYLSPEDAERVLVDAWGNPPGSETLGMIVPTEAGLFGQESWAVIISYEEEGYVSDEDAEGVNYDELLRQMREDSKNANKARAEAGYEPVELIGWAEEPYYDTDSHKLYWAKELKFGDSETNILNYNIRILGRKGVLLLNVVSGISQLSVITPKVPTLLAMTEFNPGSRYTDFDPKVDKIAAYGIGALIAGKVASKVGLLAKLGGILLVLKKFWIAIAIAIGAFFKRFFMKKDKGQVSTPVETTKEDI